MWKTGRSREARFDPRPIRVAYLVPEEPSHDLLDVLFDESMSRWGGRRTPVIPIGRNDVGNEYQDFLDLWDADLIYSYVDLSDELHDRIALLWAPSSIILHEYGDGEKDKNSLIPRFGGNYSFLSCLSILPMIARHRNLRGGGLPEVLDRERGTKVPRDLEDSFGFASNHLIDFHLLPNGRRLSFRSSDDATGTPRFDRDEEISYLEDLFDLKAKIANDRSLLTVGQMSDMFVPYLNPLTKGSASWEDHLSIVIGNEVSDRLLYWNAIHRYKSLSETRDIQVLRLSPDQFEEGIPDWLMDLCSGKFNGRHFDRNAAPRTTVRSCSASEEFLEEVAKRVSSRSHNIATSKVHESPSLFQPLGEHVRRNRMKGIWGDFPSIWSRSIMQREKPLRFSDREIELPLVVPHHIKNEPLGPTTTGAWAVDLQIERHEDHCQYLPRRHIWMFPRRLALHRGVDVENYGQDMLTLPPQFRPTESGELTVYDDMRWMRPTIHLPSDLEAFGRALSYYHPNTLSELNSYKGESRSLRFDNLEIGDKGSALLGALKFFRNFPEAVSFLTNNYILDIIRKLSPAEPSENPGRIERIARELEEDIAAHGDETNYEVIAKEILARATNWVNSDSNLGNYLAYTELLSMVPGELNGNEKRERLDGCLKYLRERQFLHQGYGWDCRTCGHRNWVSLADMKASLNCDICKREKYAPVSSNDNIHFMLNSYVSSAFSAGLAQGPVIWCLGELARLAKFSFMFAPTLDIERSGDSPVSTDLDVLACIDGEVNLIEVKTSFAGIGKKEIDQIIELAGELRPDFVGFAVARPKSESTMTPEDQTHIDESLKQFDVQFRLLTLDGSASYGAGIPRSTGEEMIWSAW